MANGAGWDMCVEVAGKREFRYSHVSVVYYRSDHFNNVHEDDGEYPRSVACTVVEELISGISACIVMQCASKTPIARTMSILNVRVSLAVSEYLIRIWIC